MKIVLATEVYPPRAGGAGWSTRALAMGLREAGHQVTVITTSQAPPDLDGLEIVRLHVSGRRRFLVPPAIRRALLAREWDVAHAQHSLAALGCLSGEHARRVVVTVRDHWPVCFWSTRISRGALCPACGVRPMTRCVKGHIGVPDPLSWGAIPYMRFDLHQKRKALARAGAVLAVSEAIAAELRAQGHPVTQVIPNIVDATELQSLAREAPPFPLPERFLLFVGKLEENKGARALVPAVLASRTGLPLVVLGEGSLTHVMKFEAAAAGVTLILRGWTYREDVLKVMARATAVVFPSLWPEPLSRVLLEAIALGTPVAAMNTGGTREILVHGESGLVVESEAALADAVASLVNDRALRDRIAAGARERSHTFAPETLIPRYEAVYRALL